ncbi:hypothetical protein LCGC14_0534780 [marine sediment metagenome]|uniref:Uncharacterized protein n=1 Tax=marine sediment metagenome TaxID=412755 RepID=A0A0F9SD00_9ZZZZ
MPEGQKTFYEMMKEEPDEPSQSSYIKHEQIIDLTELTKFEVREYTYGDRTAKKRVYTKANGEEIILPMILHRDIKKLIKELGEKLKKIKILVEGQGKQTRYTVIPLL